MEWTRYKRKGETEMRPYVEGEDLSEVSVSADDTPQHGGMIARHPENHEDQWYVNKQWFDDNYQRVHLIGDPRPPAAFRYE